MSTEIIERTKRGFTDWPTPTTPQALAEASHPEVNPDVEGSAIKRRCIVAWRDALEAMLTEEERREFAERVAQNRPYVGAAAPRRGTALNLYLWALTFDAWSEGRDTEMPAAGYVKAFEAATGIKAEYA